MGCVDGSAGREAEGILSLSQDAATTLTSFLISRAYLSLMFATTRVSIFMGVTIVSGWVFFASALGFW